MSSKNKWAMTAIFVLVQFFLIILYFYSLGSPHLHSALTAEDHIGEWAQFLFYAIACVSLCCFIFTRLHSWERLERGVLALALFILAGEEISWGQRIFHFSVDSIKLVNRQGEFNVHNMLPLYGNVGIYIVWCIFFFSIVPLSGVAFSQFLRKQRGKKFQSIFVNFGFIFTHFELLLFYLFLRREEHIYFYEFSEIVIALSFCHLVLMDFLERKNRISV